MEKPPFIYRPYTRPNVVTQHWAERYEREAARNWDLFYRRHRDKFFKDRHYLQAEWPELSASGDDLAAVSSADAPILDGAALELEAALSSENQTGEGEGGERLLLEAGCGVGNTLFPLLAANPRLRCFAFDFSDAAVELVQQHPMYATGRQAQPYSIEQYSTHGTESLHGVTD